MAGAINRVAVVILNWNGAEIIKRSINSLMRQTFSHFKIIVVDNGSTDESLSILAEEAKQWKSKLEVIKNNKNLGFAGGVNVGINYALKEGFDAVGLLNNDAVADKGWLSYLVEVLNSKREVGIVTGLLLNEDGSKIDSAGDWYSIWGLPFPRSRDEPSQMAPQSGYVFGATGGASLYRSQMLNDIGLFDEDFFAYYEDVDMSFRAQLANWRVFYCREAVAYHLRGFTSSRIAGFTTYQTLKNLPILFIKNVPMPLLLPIAFRLSLIYWAVFLNHFINQGPVPAIKGALAALRYLPMNLCKRKIIQKRLKVSAAYLRSIIWPELPPTHRRLRRYLALLLGR